jgi:NAD(P)-dependent dehydrogenase (short-subunit alcohol dehydrogenase family)
MTTGRAVVVTAGAAGIGLAIAKAFAANGDRVHICDINQGSLAQVTDANPAITSTVCDISQQAAVEQFIEAAVEALGGIDVLVNNAGISGPTVSIEEMDPGQWEAVLAVNLTGTFNVTRLAIPHLKNSQAGVIINMASVGGRFGYPNRSPYATTKRGVIALTETLALELGGDGIRANAIAPGAVAGDRIQRVLQGRAEASGRGLEDVTADALSIQALKYFVDPDDIAALALFLCSEQAKSISGQTIAIDGFSKAAQ